MVSYVFSIGAVFKWLWKVTTAIATDTPGDLKNLTAVFQPIITKTKTNCTSYAQSSRSLSKLQAIARHSDWFIPPFAPVVIGRSNYFGIGFLTVIWKPLQSSINNYRSIEEKSTRNCALRSKPCHGNKTFQDSLKKFNFAFWKLSVLFHRVTATTVPLLAICPVGVWRRSRPRYWEFITGWPRAVSNER